MMPHLLWEYNWRGAPITTNGRFRSFTLPRLQAYEVILVE